MPAEGRYQNARLAPEAIGLVRAARLVIVACSSLAFGDFRSHDLLDFGLGEPAPVRLPGAETGYGTCDMGTASTCGGRRGPNGNSTGVVDRG